MLTPANLCLNQRRQAMNCYRRLGESLLRFASSQKNVDRVAIWLGGTVAVLASMLAGAIAIMLLLR